MNHIENYAAKFEAASEIFKQELAEAVNNYLEVIKREKCYCDTCISGMPEPKEQASVEDIAEGMLAGFTGDWF